MALFAMNQIDQTNYAVAHALQTAVACDVYGRFVESPPAERLALVGAALTMNIAMLDLQCALTQQVEPPTPEQREAIHTHPVRGRETLEQLGVNDGTWLRTVTEHHVEMDGRGYPTGIVEPLPLADVLNIADRYCAKMSPRRRRSAMTSDRAARDLFVSTAGARKDVVTRLIKAFGLYPPGNIVKLANGEVAVVIRRGAQANKPRVATVISALGVPLTHPVARDTAEPAHAVSHVLGDRNAPVRLDFVKLFGLKDRS